MSLREFNKYLTAIDAVSGSEKMTDLGIADYPHMKKDSRNKFFKQIDKSIKPLKKKKDLSEIGKLAGGL